MSKWKPFWFEGNQMCGWIDTTSKWIRVKKAYKDTDLSKAKESVSYSESTGRPCFGFRGECKGPGTLGSFFKKHKMRI